VGAERTLERNAEKAHSFQLASPRERPCVNRTLPTRFDQLGDRRLRRYVVTGDEDIERLTSHRPGDQRSGEGGYVGLGMKRGHMPALLALHVPW
jgi:hypothetical protein